MKIINLAQQPNFKQLLVTSIGLKREGRGIVDKLESQLSYLKEINELDKKGIDVVIYPLEDRTGKRAKVSIIDSDNRIFAYMGKGYVATKKEIECIPINESKYWAYYTNRDEVMQYIKSVLNGSAEVFTRKTASLKQILKHFPIRDNWLYKLFK